MPFLIPLGGVENRCGLLRNAAIILIERDKDDDCNIPVGTGQPYP
jgi:hypothetical protein